MRSPMSRVVKAVLLIRSSKRLFSSRERAEREIAKMTEKPVEYNFNKADKLRSDVVLDTSLGMQDYVLSSGRGDCGKRIIYLHGGAFARQPSSTHWRLADTVVQETGAVMHFVVYPKAPLHKYNETYDKLLELYKNLLKTTQAKDIFLMGDSAGANIHLAFSMWLKQKGLPAPAHVICFSPCVDMTLSNPDITETLIKSDPMLGIDGLSVFVRAWAGETEFDDPMISPINGDLTALPPTTMFIGTDEILLPDVRLFKEKACAAGADVKVYEYQYMNHCFVLFPLKEGRDAVKRAVEIIDNL